jgi:hypothetical protein
MNFKIPGEISQVETFATGNKNPQDRAPAKSLRTRPLAQTQASRAFGYPMVDPFG